MGIAQFQPLSCLRQAGPHPRIFPNHLPVAGAGQPDRPQSV